MEIPPINLSDKQKISKPTSPEVPLGFTKMMESPILSFFELGLEPLETRWTKLRAGYWRTIIVYNKKRMIRKIMVYNYRQVNANPAFMGWCTTTKNILRSNDNDLFDAWTNP